MINYLCENYMECQNEEAACWHSHPHELSKSCDLGLCDKDGKFDCLEIILKKEDKKDGKKCI